jgi:hypothetical protein
MLAAAGRCCTSKPSRLEAQHELLFLIEMSSIKNEFCAEYSSMGRRLSISGSDKFAWTSGPVPCLAC